MKLLMKGVVLMMFISSFITISTAQATNKELGFNYQAVARDNDGNPLANKKMVVEISIRKGSESGQTLWQETHDVTTNEFGLFSLVIGQGNTTGVGKLSTFKDIDWSSLDYYTGVRADFGNGLLPMGNVKLQAVPYALVAGYAINTPKQKLKELADVTGVNVTTNSILKWNGTAWIPVDFDGKMAELYTKIKLDSTELRTLINANMQLPQEILDRKAADQAISKKAVSDSTALRTFINNNQLAITQEKSTRESNEYIVRLKQVSDSSALRELINKNTKDISDDRNERILSDIKIKNKNVSDSAYLRGLININANGLATEITNRTGADNAIKAKAVSDSSALKGFIDGKADKTLSNLTNTTTARTNLGLGSIATQNVTYTLPSTDGTTGQVLSTDGSGNINWLSLSSDYLSVNSNLSDVPNPATARTNLGLGSISVQNESSVSISGGSIDGTSIGSNSPSTGSFTSVTTSGKIGIGTSSPNSSAALDISSTNGGLLFPRLTSSQRDALTKSNGLVLYNTDSKTLQISTGASESVTISQVSKEANMDAAGYFSPRGQSFLSTGAGQLVLKFGINDVVNPGHLQFDLYDNISKSTLLASSNNLEINTAGEYTFVFSGYNLTKNTRYYFETNINDAGRYNINYSNSNAYADGECNLDPSYDLCFDMKIGKDASWANLVTEDKYKFPNSDGNVGQVLSTDGAGNIGWLSLSSNYLSLNSNLSDVPNPASARTNLGLGTIATQNVSYALPTNDGTTGQVLSTDGSGNINWVSLSTNYLTLNNNLLDVPNKSLARTNLGLEIGTNVQAFDSDLSDLADGSLTATKIAGGNVTNTEFDYLDGLTGSIQTQINTKSDLTLSNLSNVSSARTNLGLGSIATQNSNAASISGGTINGTSIGSTTPSTGKFTTLSTSGQVGIGTNNPASCAAMEISSTNGTLVLPRLTTAQRDALTNIVEGSIIFNKDANKFQGAFYHIDHNSLAISNTRSWSMTMNVGSGVAQTFVSNYTGKLVSSTLAFTSGDATFSIYVYSSSDVLLGSISNVRLTGTQTVDLSSLNISLTTGSSYSIYYVKTAEVATMYPYVDDTNSYTSGTQYDLWYYNGRYSLSRLLPWDLTLSIGIDVQSNVWTDLH